MTGLFTPAETADLAAFAAQAMDRTVKIERPIGRGTSADMTTVAAAAPAYRRLLSGTFGVQQGGGEVQVRYRFGVTITPEVLSGDVLTDLFDSVQYRVQQANRPQPGLPVLVDVTVDR